MVRTIDASVHLCFVVILHYYLLCGLVVHFCVGVYLLLVVSMSANNHLEKTDSNLQELSTCIVAFAVFVTTARVSACQTVMLTVNCACNFMLTNNTPVIHKQIFK